MRTVNVERMRRYRERTSGQPCATCRDLYRRMDETPDFTVARWTVGIEHFRHVMRDHPDVSS